MKWHYLIITCKCGAWVTSQVDQRSPNTQTLQPTIKDVISIMGEPITTRALLKIVWVRLYCIADYCFVFQGVQDTTFLHLKAR